MGKKPVALLVLPMVLLSLILIGYICLFWALAMQPLSELFRLSGSSLLTLGYASGSTVAHKLLEFSEAMIGLIADREQAWRDFAGWRVNYDVPLIALAAFTMAPYAPWSSDRSPVRPRQRGQAVLP